MTKQAAQQAGAADGAPSLAPARQSAPRQTGKPLGMQRPREETQGLDVHEKRGVAPPSANSSFRGAVGLNRFV